jgi:hypothetical protein
LTNKLFRRDQVWFCEKDQYGATDLYSLAEYKEPVRNDAVFGKNYLQGKYGAIPYVGEIDLQVRNKNRGKTEPGYFREFPNNPDVYDKIDIYGTGYNTVSLVREAIRIKHEAIQKKEPYIVAWCAYSIEAFELWYLLHFNYYDAALSRGQYQEKLSELLKKPYAKNDSKMYKILQKRQSTAPQNAQKLFARQCGLPIREQNPVTTVFRLVEQLMGETPPAEPGMGLVGESCHMRHVGGCWKPKRRETYAGTDLSAGAQGCRQGGARAATGGLAVVAAPPLLKR